MKSIFCYLLHSAGALNTSCYHFIICSKSSIALFKLTLIETCILEAMLRYEIVGFTSKCVYLGEKKGLVN